MRKGLEVFAPVLKSTNTIVSYVAPILTESNATLPGGGSTTATSSSFSQDENKTATERKRKTENVIL
jgi:hypothetical protein